jgi:hypothetical protein
MNFTPGLMPDCTRAAQVSPAPKAGTMRSHAAGRIRLIEHRAAM